jgi:hypothetical protein
MHSEDVATRSQETYPGDEEDPSPDDVPAGPDIHREIGKMTIDRHGGASG